MWNHWKKFKTQALFISWSTIDSWRKGLCALYADWCLYMNIEHCTYMNKCFAMKSSLAVLLIYLCSERAVCITWSSSASTDIGWQFWWGTSDRNAYRWDHSGMLIVRQLESLWVCYMWWSKYIQELTSLSVEVGIDIDVMRTLHFGLLFGSYNRGGRTLLYHNLWRAASIFRKNDMVLVSKGTGWVQLLPKIKG